jgi:hypothetical protein
VCNSALRDRRRDSSLSLSLINSAMTAVLSCTHPSTPNTTLHYTTLHCTTLHYIALHYTTLHCTTLHYTTLHYTTLHYTTLHCTTLHYTTLHYTTLHYTALHYIALHYTTLHCTTLHYQHLILILPPTTKPTMDCVRKIDGALVCVCVVTVALHVSRQSSSLSSGYWS